MQPGTSSPARTVGWIFVVAIGLLWSLWATLPVIEPASFAEIVRGACLFLFGTALVLSPFHKRVVRISGPLLIVGPAWVALGVGLWLADGEVRYALGFLAIHVLLMLLPAFIAWRLMRPDGVAGWCGAGRMTLWTFIVLGLFADFVLVYGGLSYLPSRIEDFSPEVEVGMGLATVWFGWTWLAAPFVAVVARHEFRRSEIIFAFVPLFIALTLFIAIQSLT